MKLLRRVLLTVGLTLALATTALAANRVDTMNVGAIIHDDGSMTVTQTWVGSFTEGTENYIVMQGSDYMTLSNLTATMDGVPYETLDDWNVNASFDDKAYRCGINDTGSGYEICFGISAYGDHVYTFTYTLNQVLASYSDYDGMNFRFVNDDLNTGPTEVSVGIVLENGTQITDENADIWGFGFEGQVGFADGVAVGYSEDDLGSRNHVTIMLGLEKGVIQPTRTVNGSFEAVKDTAFEGSDYGDDDVGFFESIFRIFFIFVQMIGPFVLGFGVLFVTIIKRQMRKSAIKKFEKSQDYFRDIPNDGDLNFTWALGDSFELCEEGAILSTRMLQLIDGGALTPITVEQVSLFGGVKELTNLKLEGWNADLDPFDRDLYRLLEDAAGEDGILESKELEVFLKKHDKQLRSFISRCQGDGNGRMRQLNVLKKWSKTPQIKDLTPEGERQLGQLMGFKKYLEDFTLLNEHGVKEVTLWKDLMAYAMLFGLADKVAEQLAVLYPEQAVEVRQYHATVRTAYFYHYALYSNMRRSEQRREAAARRNSGGGGRSSFGGGGGFSGGGSGGGSR